MEKEKLLELYPEKKGRHKALEGPHKGPYRVLKGLMRPLGGLSLVRPVRGV